MRSPTFRVGTMLGDATAKSGYSVLRPILKPTQKAKTPPMRIAAKITVVMYPFFIALDSLALAILAPATRDAIILSLQTKSQRYIKNLALSRRNKKRKR